MTRFKLYYSVFLTLRIKYGFAGIIKTLWEDVAFDFIRGTNTFSPVGKQHLFSEELAEQQNRYVPSTFALVKSGIAHMEYLAGPLKGNFIDYGSGKGKVLIGAAKHPFEKLIGIEYSSELHEIAIKNMAKLELDSRVEHICGDAADYQLQPADKYLYFFNPFMGEILERCLQNIQATAGETERFLIYANPVDDKLVCRYFRKLDSRVFQPGSVHVNFYSTSTDSTKMVHRSDASGHARV